jgi:uncharacterized membrane protein
MVDELIGSGLSRELVVVIMSALPVTELRGALPVAIKLFHLPWYQALYLAIIGNMLPVPFLLLFFESLARGISRIDTGKKLVNLLFKQTRRHTAVIEKYERIGLVALVAIPLPGTGAWTGSIAAFLCGMRFGDALLSIAVGVIVSGAIVTVLSLLGWLGAIIAGFVLSSMAILALWRARHSSV